MKNSLNSNALISSSDLCLRICQDVIYVHQTASNTYIIKNVRTERYFHVSSRTVSIMKNLDGTHTLEALSTKFNLPNTAIRYVIDQLATLQLIEGYTPTDTVQKNWLIRCSKLFFIRKDLVTSDAWIDTVYRVLRLKYIFRPWLLLLLLCLYTMGGILCIRYSSVLGKTMGHMAKDSNNLFGYLIPFFAIAILSSVLHELAHAFACKHFGGKIHSLGIGLYYFRPVFYCDVTDAWMFTKQSQRLITHAAGLMMNFFLCSLGLLLLPYTLDMPWMQTLITINFFISGVYVLVNLNPLIRLDGYYLLADALKINNLQRLSSNILYANICYALYKIRIIKNRPLRQKEQRTLYIKTFLLAYALLSCGYLLFLIWLLGESLYSFLPEANWAWRLLLSSIFFVLFIAFPFWGRWRSHSGKKRLLQKYTTNYLT